MEPDAHVSGLAIGRAPNRPQRRRRVRLDRTPVIQWEPRDHRRFVHVMTLPSGERRLDLYDAEQARADRPLLSIILTEDQTLDLLIALTA